MHILAIGNDPHFFDKQSEARARMKLYAQQFDALHIVTLAPRHMRPVQDGAQLFLWPAYGWANIIRISLRVAQCHRIDCVDAQDASEFGLAAWIVARWTRKPLRLQVHTDIMSPWYRRAAWKERIRYWLALFLLPRATCIRVVSDRIKKSILSHVKGHKSHVVVLPIRTDVQKFLDAREDPVITARFSRHSIKIIAVGRFVEKEKNFSMLIDCMREIVKKHPTALLVIVGDGPDFANYKLQITNYKLEDNIILEPWRDDVHVFYKSFDLFVSSSNYEGWGRAVIEAMASGLPIVMTDVGLAGEVVRHGENGIIVPVQDENAMTHAILKLIKNKKERGRLAVAAQKTAVNFQIPEEEYAQHYVDALRLCERAANK